MFIFCSKDIFAKSTFDKCQIEVSALCTTGQLISVNVDGRRSKGMCGMAQRTEINLIINAIQHIAS